MAIQSGCECPSVVSCKLEFIGSLPSDKFKNVCLFLSQHKCSDLLFVAISKGRCGCPSVAWYKIKIHWHPIYLVKILCVSLCLGPGDRNALILHLWLLGRSMVNVFYCMICIRVHHAIQSKSCLYCVLVQVIEMLWFFVFGGQTTHKYVVFCSMMWIRANLVSCPVSGLCVFFCLDTSALILYLWLLERKDVSAPLLCLLVN
jgi:hypothetical protein